LSGRVSGEGVGQGVGNIRYCIMHDTQTLRQLLLFYYSEASISFLSFIMVLPCSAHKTSFCHGKDAPCCDWQEVESCTIILEAW